MATVDESAVDAFLADRLSDAPSTEATPVDAFESETSAPTAAAAETAPTEGAPKDWQAEIEKRNRENQSLRQRMKKYEDVFGSYDEQDQNTLLSLVQMVRDDPSTADGWWQENISARLRGDMGRTEQVKAQQEIAAAAEAAGAVSPPAAPAASTSGLSADEVQKMIAQAMQERDNQRFLADYEKTANDLGFDSDSPFYAALCHVAANKTGGDVRRANEMLREMGRDFFGAATSEVRQQVIDEFVAEKAGKPDTTLPSSVQSPTPEPRVPKSTKEADKMLNQWLQEQGITGTRGR